MKRPPAASVRTLERPSTRSKPVSVAWMRSRVARSPASRVSALAGYS
nr:hypothetical protein [Methylobacterium indicum]